MLSADHSGNYFHARPCQDIWSIDCPEPMSITIILIEAIADDASTSCRRFLGDSNERQLAGYGNEISVVEARKQNPIMSLQRVENK